MENITETVPVTGKKRKLRPDELPKPGDIFISAVSRSKSHVDKSIRLEVNVVTGNDAVEYGGLTDMTLVEISQFNTEDLYLTMENCKLSDSLQVVNALHLNMVDILSATELGWLKKKKQLPAQTDEVNGDLLHATSVHLCPEQQDKGSDAKEAARE